MRLLTELLQQYLNSGAIVDQYVKLVKPQEHYALVESECVVLIFPSPTFMYKVVIEVTIST